MRQYYRSISPLAGSDECILRRPENSYHLQRLHFWIYPGKGALSYCIVNYTSKHNLLLFVSWYLKVFLFFLWWANEDDYPSGIGIYVISNLFMIGGKNIHEFFIILTNKKDILLINASYYDVIYFIFTFSSCFPRHKTTPY